MPKKSAKSIPEVSAQDDLETCKALEELCRQTDTAPDDWEEMDGPETGVGVERWYVNKDTQVEAYTCDDQGEITVSFGGDDDGE